MKKNNILNNEEKFILSCELLQLMEWIVENEAESLKKIITKALKKGFFEKLKNARVSKDFYTVEDAQNSILDFLGLLEVLLFESTNEQMVNDVIQKHLVPAIDHVDTKNCDSSILKSSIAIASSKLERNPKGNAQDLFLKELLKRWKPYKGDIIN